MMATVVLLAGMFLTANPTVQSTISRPAAMDSGTGGRKVGETEKKEKKSKKSKKADNGAMDSGTGGGKINDGDNGEGSATDKDAKSAK